MRHSFCVRGPSRITVSGESFDIAINSLHDSQVDSSGRSPLDKLQAIVEWKQFANQTESVSVDVGFSRGEWFVSGPSKDISAPTLDEAIDKALAECVQAAEDNSAHHSSRAELCVERSMKAEMFAERYKTN